MQTLGNSALLERELVGYLASSKIATLSVLPTLDWANAIAKRDDVAVMSGFHSQLERHVLERLLRGRCGIICVLARGIYKQIPATWAEAYASGRVLFISNEPDNVTMVGKSSALRRNQFIANKCQTLVVSSLNPQSSLYEIVKSCKTVLNI